MHQDDSKKRVVAGRKAKDSAAAIKSGMPAEERAYDVGYAKPPTATRFKKGKSGNPKGRPRGSKNKTLKKADEIVGDRLKALVLEEAYRDIRINEGNRRIDVPIAKAVIRSVAHNAARGNIRAQRLFTEMVATSEAERVKDQLEFYELATAYKAKWDAELRRRRELGTTGPEPIPHPDHIIVNPRTGEVRIMGPMSEEEKLRWDWLHSTRAAFEEEKAYLEEDIRNNENPDLLPALENELEFRNRVLNQIREALPKPDPHIDFINDLKARKQSEENIADV